MRALSARQLLNLWDQGMGQSLPGRALLLLAAACPDDSPEALAQLSVGQRDAHLLRLREQTFGPQLTGVSDCPECKTRLELWFNVSDLLAYQGSEPAGGISVSIAGYDVSFRLPDSRDLESLVASDGLARNRQLLLERCITGVRRDDGDNGSHLPVEVSDAIVEEMARYDCQADVQLDLRCSSCGHRWQVLFDIVSYLWSEVDTWAKGIMREVHVLATAYGWSEAGILDMSARRRQRYVEMAGE